MEHLYVIQLQENKWYVGKTKNFNARMDQHVTGDGAAWCHRYGPQIQCSTHGQFLDATHEETKKTLELMMHYGINNVRGAEYCQLDYFTIADCKRMSYAVLHHLKRSDREEIERTFNRNYIINDAIRNDAYHLSPPHTRRPEVYQAVQHSATAHRAAVEVSGGTPVSTNSLKRARSYNDSEATDGSLYSHLCDLRTQLARSKSVEPHFVFFNKTLDDIVEKKPTTREELLEIHGIGEVKLVDYGTVLLSTINDALGHQSCRHCGTKIKSDPSKPSCYRCWLARK